MYKQDLIYMYKQDLALNHLQWLIYHKNKLNQIKTDTLMYTKVLTFHVNLT